MRVASRVCDFSFCRRSLAETSKIIANSCCAAVRLCSAAAAKRPVMLPLDERPPGELRIARALPLSDPYDALATWKSAKRTHQERLKSELDDTFRKKGKLERALSIEEEKAERTRRQRAELDRIENARKQRELDAVEERSRMDRDSQLNLLEPSIAQLFQRLQTPESIVLPLAIANVCSLQALAFLDHRSFAKSHGLVGAPAHPGRGTLERLLEQAAIEARRTICIAIIDSLTLPPDMEWEKGQRRVAAAMMAEAERRDLSETTSADEDLQELDDDFVLTQRQQRREQRRRLRRERQRQRRERAAQIPRGPFRRALVRSVAQWHDFLETEPSLGDRLATRFGDDGPAPTWKETSAWALWMLRSQLKPNSRANDSPRSRRTKGSIEQCLKHAKNHLWRALYPSLNSMQPGEWRLYWMRVEQSFSVFFTQNSRMCWKEAAASNARAAALRLGKSSEAQEEAATRAVHVVRAIMVDRDLTPPKSLSPRRSSTSPVRTTSPASSPPGATSQVMILHAPLDIDDAVRKRMGLSDYLSESEVKEQRLKQQRRERMQRIAATSGVGRIKTNAIRHHDYKDKPVTPAQAASRSVELPLEDVAPNQLPSQESTPPPLAPAGYAVPETNSEGVFTLVKAGPPPGGRRLSRESRDSRESRESGEDSSPQDASPGSKEGSPPPEASPGSKEEKPYQETGSAPQSRISRARTDAALASRASRASSESLLRRPSDESVLRRPSSESVLRRPSSESVLRRPSDESVLRRSSKESVLRRPSTESLLRRASSESNEAKQGRYNTWKGRSVAGTKRGSPAQAVHEIPFGQDESSSSTVSDSDSDSSGAQIKVSFIDGGRKVRHAGLLTWTPSQLAEAVCEDLIMDGRMREKPTSIRTDRSKELTEMFVKGGLNGVRMKTITENELDHIVRKFAKGQPWTEDVQIMLKAMLPKEEEEEGHKLKSSEPNVADDCEEPPQSESLVSPSPHPSPVPSPVLPSDGPSASAKRAFNVATKPLRAGSAKTFNVVAGRAPAVLAASTPGPVPPAPAPPVISEVPAAATGAKTPQREPPTQATTAKPRQSSTANAGRSASSLSQRPKPRATASSSTVVASVKPTTVVATKVVPSRDTSGSAAPAAAPCAEPSLGEALLRALDTNEDGKLTLEDIPFIGSSSQPSPTLASAPASAPAPAPALAATPAPELDMQVQNVIDHPTELPSTSTLPASPRKGAWRRQKVNDSKAHALAEFLQISSVSRTALDAKETEVEKNRRLRPWSASPAAASSPTPVKTKTTAAAAQRTASAKARRDAARSIRQQERNRLLPPGARAVVDKGKGMRP